MLSITKDETPSTYNAAVKHRNAGRLEEALTNYNRAIELDPTMIDAYINRGNIYRDLECSEEQALQIDPNDSILNLNIGVLLANQGNLEAALPYFEQSAKQGDVKAADYVV